MLLAAGCASTSKFKAQMNSWMGADINQTIMSWGPPSNEYTMPNGLKQYTWMWVGGTFVNSNYNQFLNMVNTTANTAWCQRTLIVDTRGKIQGWQANGTACRAR